MKLHYFDHDKADNDDYFLQMAIAQGYVPNTCLLGGNVVFSEVNLGKDPCAGCNCPREKCHGRPRK
jgi:hypothetical protein